MRNFTWCIDAQPTQDTQLKTNAVQFGDGYEQVSSFGINNARTAWQLSKTGYASEIDEVYQFLLDHKGVTPFSMTLSSVTGTYRTDGNIGKAHLGANVWQVTFAVKQVFIP